uniref:Uncharacterized protein n=1 Tax=Rhizophora mucronata TaxID=61149 RepID=A0A2P2LVL9_RHIMU
MAFLFIGSLREVTMGDLPGIFWTNKLPRCLKTVFSVGHLRSDQQASYAMLSGNSF